MVGDFPGRPPRAACCEWSPNTHQPKEKPISTRRGERDGVGRRGPFWQGSLGDFHARVLFIALTSWATSSYHPPTGDHKGPPNPTSSALAPTDQLACCLTSGLRLMPIGSTSRPALHPRFLNTRGVKA